SEFSQSAHGSSDDISGIHPANENRRHSCSDVDEEEWMHPGNDCNTESMCEDGTACSHLTGGFTTITNIFDGSPDAVVDQRCTPARSTFQLVGVMDTPSTNAGEDASQYDHDSHFGTFASYYYMQKNGPHSPDAHIGCGHMIMKQYEIDDDAEHSVDTEEGGGRGFCEQHHAVQCCHDVNDDHISKGGRSSLSSITNEFFFPKFNGRGRFINYGTRKKNSSTKKSSSSPQSSKERKSPSSYTLDTTGTMVAARAAAPWYSISRLQLQPHFHLEDYSDRRQQQEHHAVPNNDQFVGHHAHILSRPPSEVVISPLGHANPLETCCPHSLSQTPSVISSSDLSQYFTNELRERYKSIIHRSYRTHYHQFINSSCARKTIIAIVSISLLVAMITSTTIVLGRHVPRAWTDGANITLVIPGRDGMPYACCVDSNTGLYIPQDGSTSNLPNEHDNTSEQGSVPPPSSSSESSSPEMGSVLEDTGLISFSSSQGGNEPTNNPFPTMNFAPNPGPAPNILPTASPTKDSKMFGSLEATPTTTGIESLLSPTHKPVVILGPVALDPSIVRIKSVDTTIDELSPNVNYGDESYLSVEGNTKVALVKFDLSVLNGRSYNKATLVINSLLNEEADESAAHVTVGVLPQAGDWNEGLLTWTDAGSSRAGSFVVNQFQSDSSQTRRHEVDVLRAIENALRPSFQGGAPSGIVTFELYTESGSIAQFASREWNGGALEPELRIYLSDNSSPSISPTRMPLTNEPSAAPFTSVPSVEFSITPNLLYIEPSVSPTPHPVAPTSQVPSVMSSEMTSESPTGSPNSPTVSPNSPSASPINPTASPHDPTISPLHPSDSPIDQPTMRPETEAPIVTQVAMIAFEVCPNVQSSSTMASRNDLISYQVGSTWKVYKCAEDRCSAGSSMPGSSWILVGTCQNKLAERDGSHPTSEVSTPEPSRVLDDKDRGQQNDKGQ
ncbi:hypothetical protein ACHAXH_006809, partial [Discostella pseudostelligera]